MNILTSFCADLFQNDIIIFGKGLGLDFFDNSLLFEITFISQNCHDTAFSSLIFYIVDPFLQTIKRGPTGYIINDNGNCSVSDIVRNQSPKSLLPSRIPKLQTNCFILKENILGYKINADSRSLWV